MFSNYVMKLELPGISVPRNLKLYCEYWKCVIPAVCVKIGKGMQSNTTMPIKVY